MQQRPRDEGRHRSPFAAAFLSLLFPGLGQAYVGFYGRALAFAAPMILIVALGGGLLINPGTRLGLLAEVSSPTTLLAILVVDVLLLVYRIVAIVDAFRLASAANVMTGAGESARLDDRASAGTRSPSPASCRSSWWPPSPMSPWLGTTSSPTTW